MSPVTADTLYRRQLLLTLLGGGLALAALAAVVIVTRAMTPGTMQYEVVGSTGAVRTHMHNVDATFVLWAAAVGLVVVAGVLAVVVFHAARVAAFAFRREVS
jgi:hypothetical protein